MVRPLWCNALGGGPPCLKKREWSHLSDLFFPILQTNPHLDGFLFDLLGSDVAERSTALGERVTKGASTCVSNFLNPMYPNDEPDQPFKRVDCTFSSQRGGAHEKPVIQNERVFDVKDCDRGLPVYFLHWRLGLQWSDPLSRITTLHPFTSTVCVLWPVHPQHALIWLSDEPIEVPPFPGSMLIWRSCSSCNM